MTQFRVILDGQGYDLMESFTGARMDTLKALLAATGRNPFAITQGFQSMDALAVMDQDTRMAAMTGAAGNQMMDLLADLMFLARRANGEKAPGDKDKPISYEQSCAQTGFFALFEEIYRSVDNDAQVIEADPTEARTDTAPGAGPATQPGT